MQKSKRSKSLTVGPKPECFIDHNHLPAQHAPPHVPMYTMWLYCTLALMHRKRSSSGPKSFASSFPWIAWLLKTFRSISDMVCPGVKPVMKKMSVVSSSSKCSRNLAGGSPNLGGVFSWRKIVDLVRQVFDKSKLSHLRNFLLQKFHSKPVLISRILYNQNEQKLIHHLKEYSSSVTIFRISLK